MVLLGSFRTLKRFLEQPFLTNRRWSISHSFVAGSPQTRSIHLAKPNSINHSLRHKRYRKSEGSAALDTLVASIILSLIVGIVALVGFVTATEFSLLLCLAYSYLLASISFAAICLHAMLFGRWFVFTHFSGGNRCVSRLISPVQKRFWSWIQGNIPTGIRWNTAGTLGWLDGQSNPVIGRHAFA